jgi:hypothetical protein
VRASSKDAVGPRTAQETASLTMTILPRPAVHKEKLGHALSLNMRCEVIHDGEIFPNHGRPDLACAGGFRFFPGIFSDTLTNSKYQGVRI